MTSNGLVLHRKLPELVTAGLDQLNISLDTLIPAKFELISRRKGHHLVLKSIDEAAKLLPVVKVNCVVMRGVNEEEVVDFVRMTEKRVGCTGFLATIC